MQEITLNNSDENGEYIELVNYVKLRLNLSTGGQAKIFIKTGEVFINGIQEMRAKKKVRKGDLISIKGEGFMV